MSTKKEEFLKIKTYEEFDKRRKEFRDMEWDEELSEHFHTFFEDTESFDEDGLYLEAFYPKDPTEKNTEQ